MSSAVLPPDADGLSLLTVAEVADLLAVTDEAVRGMVRSGKLAAYKLGDGPKAHIRVPSSAVAAFLRATSAPRVERR